jgi:hypothetical protein
MPLHAHETAYGSKRIPIDVFSNDIPEGESIKWVWRKLIDGPLFEYKKPIGYGTR